MHVVCIRYHLQDRPAATGAGLQLSHSQAAGEREGFAETLGRMREAGVPRGHRFCGVARQKANTTGSVHSDRRNYMLSTLTGLVVPQSGGGGAAAAVTS